MYKYNYMHTIMQYTGIVKCLYKLPVTAQVLYFPSSLISTSQSSTVRGARDKIIPRLFVDGPN